MAAPFRLWKLTREPIDRFKSAWDVSGNGALLAVPRSSGLVLSTVCTAALETFAGELLDRAVSLAASGRLDQAERLLTHGEGSFPEDARFLDEPAGVSRRRKQPVGAKSYLHRGLQIDTSNAYANEFLGSLYSLDENLCAALKYLNRVRRPVISNIGFHWPTIDEEATSADGTKLRQITHLRRAEVRVDAKSL